MLSYGVFMDDCWKNVCTNIVELKINTTPLSKEQHICKGKFNHEN